MRRSGAWLGVVLGLSLVGCSSTEVFQSWEGEDSPIYRKIDAMLSDDEQGVRISVFGDAFNLAGSGKGAPEAWASGARDSVIETLEKGLAQRFRGRKNFVLVPHRRMAGGLEELGESFEDFKTLDSRLRLGRRFRLTHWVFFRFERSSYEGNSFEDVARLELVDSYGGTVLARQVARKISR